MPILVRKSAADAANQDLPVLTAKPLTGCETCAFWTHCGCLKRKPGFPTVGRACRGYEREPGVEG